MDNDKRHIFDNPANVKRVLRLLYIACGGLFAIDFLVARHVVLTLESVPGFYSLYGFVGCVVLVLIARELRKIAMRKEDYYDD